MNRAIPDRRGHAGHGVRESKLEGCSEEGSRTRGWWGLFRAPVLFSAYLHSRRERVLAAPPERLREVIEAGRLEAASWLVVPNGALRPAIDRKALAMMAALFVVAIAASAAFGQTAKPAPPPQRTALEVIWVWSPLLLKGFVFNLVISALAMVIGTMAGVPLGILQTSRVGAVRGVARFLTQFFRNSPWLVLLFLCVLLLPFQIRIGGFVIPFPDWMKAIFGFSLPVMANVSEIVRGAVQSVPTSQWESAESLGFTRRQTLTEIILPQCYKRMLPPWMNLYSLITMSTVNASVVGVSEMITLTNDVLAAEGSRPALLAPLYAFSLLCFFAYCYPIGKWTVALERKWQVKL